MTSIDTSSPSWNTSDQSIDESTMDPVQSTSHIWTTSVATSLTLIALLTVIGNLLLMLSYAKDTRIRASVGNLYVLNRAIADMIIGLVVVPFSTASLLLEQWPFGLVSCQIWTVIESSAALVSVLSLFLISLDRYWLVTKKLRYQKFQSQQRALFLICCCWTVCITFYSIIVFAWDRIANQHVTPHSLIKECRLQSRNNIYLAVILFLLEFLIPLILIASLNRVVYSRIRARSKSFVHSAASLSSATAVKGKRVSSEEPPDLRGTTSSSSNAIAGKAIKSSAESSNGLQRLDETVTNVSLISIRTFPTDMTEDSVTSTTGTVTSTTGITTDRESTEMSSSPSTAATATESITDNIGMGDTVADTAAITTATPRRTPRQLSVIIEPPAAHQRPMRSNRHRKAGIALGVLVCVYVICWFPNCFVVLLNAGCQGCIPRVIAIITTYLHWCISTINPYLYAILNDKFSAAFGRLLDTARCADKKNVARQIQNFTGSATGSGFVQSKNVK